MEMNMDTITIGSKAERSGMIMPLVATIVVFIFLIGIAMLKIGFGSRFIAARTSSEITARTAADAGLASAIHLMNGTWDREPFSVTPTPLQNTRATYSYTVTNGPNFTIRSTGIADQISRAVFAMTWATSFWSYAIAVENNITFGQKIVIDVWDPEGTHTDFAPTIATNSTEEGAVTLKPNSELPGDVVVGPGGNPESVIEVQPNSDIQGDTYAADTAIDFPDVIVPSDLTRTDWPEDPCWPVLITEGRYAYNSPITIPNSKTLRISGDVVMYVAGNIDIRQGATLSIEEDSSLSLYLGGSFITGQNSEVINQTLDATKLLMYGTATCTSIQIKNSGDFYGAVYAPSADMRIYNSGATYGAFTGYSFDMKNSSEFHYDARLLDMDPSNVPSFFMVQRWWERGDEGI
ncbi:MAG: hypothetical protein JXN61_00265 [Sedimentisphaerales bacterium]|nr:hypothetical protein [Sedimentisphaerales bacterium]